MIKAILLLLPLSFLAGILKLLGIISGFVMVPIALLFKAYRTEFNKYKGNNGLPVYLFTWKIMAPWQNYSDGFYCTTYFDYGFFWTSFVWSCIRNTAAGLRWLPVYSVKPNPKEIKFIGSFDHLVKDSRLMYKNDYDAHWCYTWQGVYSGLLIQIPWFNWIGPFKGKFRRLTFGWKLYPKDSITLDPTDYRIDGAAWTLQFKPVGTV